MSTSDSDSSSKQMNESPCDYENTMYCPYYDSYYDELKENEESINSDIYNMDYTRGDCRRCRPRRHRRHRRHRRRRRCDSFSCSIPFIFPFIFPFDDWY